MKKPSFFLYLKQGIKGVLKFRIQFYVIVILTFLSTLILTISLSTTQRLTENYNEAMSKYEKFDYINQKSVGLSSDGQDAIVVAPMMDLINDEFLSVYDSTDLNNPFNNVSIEYNLNLSSFDNKYENLGYKETFLTRALEDPEVEKAFYDMLSDPDYYNNQQKYNFNPALTHRDRDNNINGTTFQNFENILISTMKEYFLQDLFPTDGETESYLLNSPFYKLKQKNIITIDNFSKEIRDESDNDPYNRYLYFALETVAVQINDMVFDYINYYVNSALTQFKKQSQTTDIEVFFNNNWAEKAGFHWIGNSANSDEIATTLFIYILGRKPAEKKFEELNTKQKTMLVSDDTNNLPWANKIDMSSSIKDGEILTSKAELYKFGARGSISQLYGKLNEEDNKLSTIPSRTVSPLFLKHESSTPFTFDIGYLSNFTDLINREQIRYSQINRGKAFFLRNEILAQATDLNYDTRAEVVLQDNVSEINYRIVVLDDFWKDKITIYEGHYPRNSNEILINPQFAKKNNLQLGSNITIGGGNFTISGFAADPLTYYPITDLMTPIPNNEKSAIVYANSDVIANQIVTSDFEKYVTNYMYNIISDNNSANVQQSMATFAAYSFSNRSELLYDYNYLTNANGINQSFYDLSKHSEKYTSFNDSPLSFNWNLTPKITRIFNLVTSIFSAVICFITLIATVIAIKKTIHLNSGEIGILKSMGARSAEISSSYLSYGVVVMVFVIPIAWIIGSLLQDPISSLFLQYVSGEYNLAIFSWIPLIICLAVFGLLLCLISYTTAAFLIRKPTLEILNKNETEKTIMWVRRLKLKITKNSKFSIRFSSELAISSFSKTLLTGTTIFFAGFFISTSLAIPGIVDNFVNSYNKNINYSNNYKNIELIGNAPLAKTSLSPTQEVDLYEENLIDSNGIFGSGIDKISKSVSSMAPSPDSSAIPQLLISPSGENSFDSVWTYDVLSNQSDVIIPNDNDEINSLISIIASILGNNLAQLVGKGISIADIQKMIEWVVHSTAQEFVNNFPLRLKKVEEISDLLTNGLPQLLVSFINNSSVTDGTWKEQIIDIIISQTPSYIKNYVTKSENRLNNFEFGWQINKYIPGIDNLYTNININSKNNKTLPVVGLSSSQTAFNIDKKYSEKLFKTEYQAQIINKLLYGEEITNQEYQLISDIYNRDTGELSIPVVSNEQTDFNINNDWDLLKGININTKRMVIRNEGVNIPNNAWMYDDRDWQHYSNPSFLTGQNESFLSMSGLQGSKFTYAPIFDYYDDNKEVNDFDRYQYADLKDNSYGFYNLNSTFNQDGSEQLDLEIRPYYQYENIVLFIPKAYKTEFEKIKNLGNKDSSGWWIDEADFVPEETIKAWNGVDDLTYDKDDFIAIRPYSLFYDQRGEYKRESENLSGEALKNINGAYNNFLAESFRQANGPLALSNIDLNWEEMSNGQVSQINFEKVGNIAVYGKSLIIADQNLINLINGFSIDKYTPFNLQYEDFDSPNNSSYTQNGVTINTYEKLNTKNVLDPENNDEWVYGQTDLQKSIRPNMWYTGVYSNVDEPYFVTTQASFAKNPKIGEDTLNGNSAYESWIEIESTTFLSQEEALINQVSAIILTVGVLFISLLVIIMILTVTLINDLYVNQYKKFMIVMKSLGYSNKEIIYYTFGFVTGFSIITYAIGVGLSYIVIYAIVRIINNLIGIIPFGMTWWSPFVATILVFGMFVISIAVTTRKIRKESPSTLVS